jgi:hypothetical protein
LLNYFGSGDRFLVILKIFTKEKRFDRLDEIDLELFQIPGDRYLLATTKSQAEYKKCKQEGNRK